MLNINISKFCFLHQLSRIILRVNIMDISLIRTMPKMVPSEYVLPSDSQTWISLNKFEELRKKRLVQIKDHIILPLKLLNYTHRAQFKKNWCGELMIARGLVVREDGMIVARPLPKFFNDYELKGPKPSGPFEVYEKLDGSCIIMGFYEGKPFFCTRGSFVSDQSIKAEEIYYSKYGNLELDHAYTYCFEIIYPKNKIVVDYGQTTDLFLFAKIHTATGIEAPITNTGFKCVQKLDLSQSIEKLKQIDEANKEGFVVKFTEDNFRMKIKFPSYISLHKRSKKISEGCIDELIDQMEQLSLEA